MATICANTGWTWPHVREHVDLPTVQALQAEWRLHPLVHHLVASYLGYKAPADRSNKALPVVDAEEFLGDLGSVPVRTGAAPDSVEFDAFMAALKSNAEIKPAGTHHG